MARDHEAAGVEPGLARTLAGLPYRLAACDVVLIAESRAERAAEPALEEAARVYFALDAALALPDLRARLARARRGWDRLALTQLADELSGVLRQLTRTALASGCAGATADEAGAAVERWLAGNVRGVDRYRAIVSEIAAMDEADLAVLSVAIRPARRAPALGVRGGRGGRCQAS